MKKINQTTLEMFLTKNKSNSEQKLSEIATLTGTTSTSNTKSNVTELVTRECENTTNTDSSNMESPRRNSNSCSAAAIISCYHTNDIGNFINEITNFDDTVKYNILKNSWKPGPTFKFPFSIHKKNKRDERRYINYSCLVEHEWLTYSDIYKGLFCKYCVIFANTKNSLITGKNVVVDKFVKRPLVFFAKLKGKSGYIFTHERTHYHRESVSAAEIFCNVYEHPLRSVTNLLDTNRAKIIEENRKRLVPIVETIILMGRQNIAFRGRRDDGKLDFQSSTNENDGNFRQILKYRANSGDAILTEHLKNSKSNATYISKTTQNELIAVCGDQIRNTIINRIKKSKFYSVIFDETTDICTMSQLSLILTYVYDNKRHEDFVDFINVHDTVFSDDEYHLEPKVTGKIIGQLVLKKISEYGLDITKCIGIGTDGCSVMISEQLGAVREIRNLAKNAFRCPCFNHAINLSISKSSNVSSIRNSIGIIKEIISFFKMSAKRMFVLNKHCTKKLKKLCETRWTEKIESLSDFSYQIENIIIALEEIGEWSDSQTATKAKILSNNLLNVDFLISLQCQVSISYLFLPITNLFQKKSVDILKVRSVINLLIEAIKIIRENADDEFGSIFQNVSTICEKLNIEIKVPRQTNRQVHRGNLPHRDPKDYYKKIIYIPLLDNVLTDLNDRFSETLIDFIDINFLIPKNLISLSTIEIKNKIEKLSRILKNLLSINNECLIDKLYSEILQIKVSAQNSEKIYATIEETIWNIDPDIYPVLCEILSIYLTLPISVASAERSFSTLKRLKTYLRSRIGHERLCGLALLNIHKEISIDIKDVIDAFARDKRRLDFIIQ